MMALFLQVGTAVTNAVINARKAVDKTAADDVENVPILSTSVAYGLYMAVSSNLRYVKFFVRKICLFSNICFFPFSYVKFAM